MSEPSADRAVNINRLAIISVSGPQGERLMQSLRAADFHFTVIDSAGGLIQIPTASLLVGLHASRLPHLIEIVQKDCQPRLRYIPTHMLPHEASVPFSVIEAQIGGAALYVLEVEAFWQL